MIIDRGSYPRKSVTKKNLCSCFELKFKTTERKQTILASCCLSSIEHYYQDVGKGGLSLRGVAFMTVLAVLTVLAVVESTLPSFCWSYKLQHNEAALSSVCSACDPQRLPNPDKFKDTKSWRRGSTGVKRHGCIPWSAANNLGEIPQSWEPQIPSSKEFSWRENTLGRPFQSPSLSVCTSPLPPLPKKVIQR